MKLDKISINGKKDTIEVLDKIFYDISLCEKGNISINEILKFPISHLPFERLN